MTTAIRRRFLTAFYRLPFCRKAEFSFRTALTAVILSVMLAVFLSASVIVKAKNSDKAQEQKLYYTNITVEKGDTLWKIAGEYMDYEHYDNIYEYMEHLTALNHLTSDNLYAGEHLIVTYYASDRN